MILKVDEWFSFRHHAHKRDLHSKNYMRLSTVQDQTVLNYHLLKLNTLSLLFTQNIDLKWMHRKCLDFTVKYSIPS